MTSFGEKRALGEESELSFKRQKSKSVSPDNITAGFEPCDLFERKGSVTPFYELDRLVHHVGLQDFGAELQKAANAVFTGDQRSRYTKVEAILLSWEEVYEWLIPAEDSQNQLQSRILAFLGNSDPQHLKIVYYAGHGRLTNHGTPAWTRSVPFLSRLGSQLMNTTCSLRNSKQERCSAVKWSGIQNSLEESRSDVFILLDCCASGVCTTDEGNGVTELIAACAYNAIANGVGSYSFTHALITKLRLMAYLPYFNIGYLYNAIYTEVSSWRIEDPRFKKAPIHLVLSQNQSLSRSICLCRWPKVHSGENSTSQVLCCPQPDDATVPKDSESFAKPSSSTG